MQNNLLYKEADDKIYLRAEGHITANLCHVLRKKILTRLDCQPKIKDIFVDLSNCTYMDSTFIGILIALNKKFNNMCGKKTQIVCPTEECNKLLSGLCLLALFSIKKKTIAFPSAMETISHNQKATVYDILESHNNIMETSEENKNKFKILKELLEKKLNSEQEKN